VAQVEYLVGNGHTNLLYVGTHDPNLRALDEGRKRAAHEHGRSLGATVESFYESDSRDLSQELAERVRAGVTAVACYNDEVAIGVLGAAARVRLAVPQQLAVIGIDDIPLAAVTHPRLTTVTLEAAHSPVADTVADHVLNGELIEPFETIPRVIKRESA
jgi:DNA-binding LacI/PurR family transcriptional regulator